VILSVLLNFSKDLKVEKTRKKSGKKIMKTLRGFKVNKTIIISISLTILLFYHIFSNSQTTIHSQGIGNQSPISKQDKFDNDNNNNNNNDGNNQEIDTPFMPKMANETLKAELGNAAWKLLHTILARYPEEPVENEKKYLDSYIKSFAQVYPCGDCARHFIKLLNKYPPQLNSRKNAALWGCFIHNKVNERLGKPIYDCTTILEDYDCGCGSDEIAVDDTLSGESVKKIKESREHLDSIIIETIEDGVGG
jgi:FAD-linked sulfhydryl oxidase